MTSKSVGSYEPAPAPTFTMERQPASASRIWAAIRGSAFRASHSRRCVTVGIGRHASSWTSCALIRAATKARVPVPHALGRGLSRVVVGR